MGKRQQRRKRSSGSLLSIARLALLVIAFVLKAAARILITIMHLLVGAARLSYWLLIGRRRRRLHYETLGAFLTLTPGEFEQAVGDLLHDLGYRSIRQTGGARDLAADLWCLDRKGRRTVVQCKRYGPGNRVGSPEMQAFIGMVTVHHQAETGIFVTTSAFTEPARILADQHGIELIDGERLTQMATRPSRHEDRRRIA